jgi:hypothetical protein
MQPEISKLKEYLHGVSAVAHEGAESNDPAVTITAVRVLQREVPRTLTELEDAQDATAGGRV